MSISFIFSRLICLLIIHHVSFVVNCSYKSIKNKIRNLQNSNSASLNPVTSITNLISISTTVNYTNQMTKYYPSHFITSLYMNKLIISIQNTSTNKLQFLAIDPSNYFYKTIDVGKLNCLFLFNNKLVTDINVNMLRISMGDPNGITLAVFSNENQQETPSENCQNEKLMLTFYSFSNLSDSAIYSDFSPVNISKYNAIMDSPRHKLFFNAICSFCDSFQLRASVYIPADSGYIAALVLTYQSKTDIQVSFKYFMIAIYLSNSQSLNINSNNILLKVNVFDELFYNDDVKADDLLSIKDITLITNKKILCMLGINSKGTNFLITVNLDNIKDISSRNIGNIITLPFGTFVESIPQPFLIYDEIQKFFVTASINNFSNNFYSLDFYLFTLSTDYNFILTDYAYSITNTKQLFENIVNKISAFAYLPPFLVLCDIYSCSSYKFNFLGISAINQLTITEWKKLNFNIDKNNIMQITRIENISTDANQIDLVFTARNPYNFNIIGKFNPPSCLFYSVPDSTRCLLDCTNLYNKIDQDKKLCMNTLNCSSDQFQDIINNQCVSQCKYYIDYYDRNYCLPYVTSTSCPSNFYELSVNNVNNSSSSIKCVQMCPEGYYFKESAPKQCIPSKLYCGQVSGRFCPQYENTLCSTQYMNGDSSPKECISESYCKNNFPFIIPSQTYLNNINNLCSKVCPTGYYEGQLCLRCPGYTINGICTDCKYNKKYSFNKVCVDKCPDGYYPDYYTWICKSINSGYLFNGYLYNSCTPPYRPNTNRECVLCKDINLFYLDDGLYGKCVAQCPQNFYYDFDNNCRSCFTPDVLNEVYLKLCCYSEEAIYSNVCPVCLDKTKFYYQSTCLDNCPEFTVTNNNSMICVNCKDKGYYYDNKRCVSSCPSNKISGDDKICKPSPAAGVTCGTDDCNGGVCSVVNNNIKCECPVNRYGNLCEFFMNDIYLNALKSLKPFINKINKTINNTITMDANYKNTQLAYNISKNIYENMQKIWSRVRIYGMKYNITDDNAVIVSKLIYDKMLYFQMKLKSNDSSISNSIINPINPSVYSLAVSIKERIYYIYNKLNNYRVSKISKEIYDTIIKYSNNFAITTNLTLSSNKIQYINDTFSAIDKALNKTISNLTNSLIKNETTEINQNTQKLKNIDDYVGNVVNDIIKQNTSDNIYSFNENLKVQLTNSSLTEEQIKQIAIDNGATYINMTECKKKVTSELKLKTNDIIVKKIEINNKIYNNTVQAVQVSYGMFNTKTGAEIDIGKYCSDIAFNVNVQLDKTKIDLIKYKEFLNLSINIYDAKDPFYKDICFSFQNSSNGLDIPLKSRVKDLAPDVKISCGTCTFLGLNDDYYAVCECIDNRKLNASLVKDFVDNLILDSNFAIFFCYEKAVDKKILPKNVGFYANGLILASTIFFIILARLVYKRPNNKILIYRDCKTFDSGMSTFEEYLENDIYNNMKKTMSNKNLKEKQTLIELVGKQSYNRMDVVANSSKDAYKGPDYDSQDDPGAADPCADDNSQMDPSAADAFDDPIKVRDINDEKDIINNYNSVKISSDIGLQINYNSQKNLKYSSTKLERNYYKDRAFQRNTAYGSKINFNKVKRETTIFRDALTETDISQLNTRELIKHDDRSSFQYIAELYMKKHSILSTFYYDSIMKPREIKIILFFFDISMQFAMNALFYSDEYIDARNLYAATRDKGEFKEVIISQFAKSVWGFIIGSIPGMILNFLFKPPEKNTKMLNEHLITCKNSYIEEGITKYYKSVTVFYISITLIALLVHLLSWYYVTAFCAVYVNSGYSWLYGGILSLLIGWLFVEIAKPIAHLIIRYLAKKYPKSRVMEILYTIALMFL